MTIHAVADKANVSISTVSRVLNHRAYIKETTKSRVLAVIEELKYHPNASARALVSKKTCDLAVIVSDITNPSYADLIKGIQSTANKNHYGVFFFDAEENVEKEINLFKILFERKVDGIIVAAPRMSNNRLNEFSHYNIPIILYNRTADTSNFYSVIINDVGGAYAAISHLCDEGHERIGLITGPIRSESTQAKYKGYKKALKRHGLEFRKELVSIGNATPHGGYKAMKKLMSLAHPPSAVFVYDDFSALGAYDCIYNAGLRIPEDISVIGSDDVYFARFLQPPLTTLHIPYYRVGTKIASTMIGLLNKSRRTKRRAFINPQLILRNSVINRKEGIN